jgi:predicted TIM-barrel fold metal-dependent hydrolase
MKLDDMVLVSVDDHVVEPPDVFVGRLAARHVERAPRVVRSPEGHDLWVFEGTEVRNPGLNAVAGKPPHRYGVDPLSYDDMRPGCYDIHARVRDMDANGVLGSMCFPSFPRFCGQVFAQCPDKDLALAVLQAYNDWHIEAWCGTYPGRFIPLALLPIWDPELMGAEVRRVARMGCRAVSFSENPAKLGLPSWHSDHWDPFLAACDETGTLVCLHIGSSSEMVVTALDAPVTVQMSLQPMNIVHAAGDLLWSRVLQRFRNVRFVLSEGGIGWVPYFLERSDFTYRHHRAWTGVDLGDDLPSELFRRRFVLCFIDDSAGLALRDRIGVDLMTWECDYPHSDSTWPRSPEVLWETLAAFGATAGAMTDAEIDAITHGNAMAHFGYDPFSILGGRAACTVGALRARAADWDVAEHDDGRPFTPPTRPLTQQTKLAMLGLASGPAELVTPGVAPASSAARTSGP